MTAPHPGGRPQPFTTQLCVTFPRAGLPHRAQAWLSATSRGIMAPCPQVVAGPLLPWGPPFSLPDQTAVLSHGQRQTTWPSILAFPLLTYKARGQPLSPQWLFFLIGRWRWPIASPWGFLGEQRCARSSDQCWQVAQTPSLRVSQQLGVLCCPSPQSPALPVRLSQARAAPGLCAPAGGARGQAPAASVQHVSWHLGPSPNPTLGSSDPPAVLTHRAEGFVSLGLRRALTSRSGGAVCPLYPPG